MKAKLYNIGPAVVTQLFFEDRAGELILWEGSSRVVEVLLSDSHEAKKFHQRNATGEVKEIFVPKSVLRGFEPGSSFVDNFIVGKWLGFLIGRGYINSIPS